MQEVLSKLQFERPRPIRLQMTDYVRELIASGSLVKGAKLPTTMELAQLWKTDVRTVHYALTVLAREGLIERYPKRGTFVRAREERLTSVAVYNASMVTDVSAYAHRLHAALREELAQAGVAMDVWMDPRSRAQMCEAWPALVKGGAHRRFQALIVTSAGRPQLEWLRKVPVPAAFHSSILFPQVVTFDLNQLAEVSLQALAQQGCRSVGLIAPLPTAPSLAMGHSVWENFYARFIDRCGDLGLQVKNPWMCVTRHEEDMAGRSQEAYGYEQVHRLWAQDSQPDGLVVYPDTVVRGVILGLLEKRVRVPEDLKLVLHKNEAVDLLCPLPATFVVASERAVAQALIVQIQRQLRGEPGQTVLLPFTSFAVR